MPKYRASKRFSPSSITEMLVPFFLVILLSTLLVVFIIIALSLFGVTPPA